MAAALTFNAEVYATPHRRLMLTTLLVEDYDAAITFFVDRLGFVLVDDTPLSDSKRWVVVAPSAECAGLLLARAGDDAQVAAIGRQAGGRVLLFLHTDDIARDYAAWSAAGVHFVETPRTETYGKVVVFEDLYGNRWDLIEPAAVVP